MKVPYPKKVTFNRDNKFDLQLSDALIAERRLAEIFVAGDIKTIELKTETWLWEQTGNILISYSDNGRPTGIAITQAGYWVHELRRNNQTLCYLMFPIDRLKKLARHAYRNKAQRRSGGDSGRVRGVIIPLSDILK